MYLADLITIVSTNLLFTDDDNDDVNNTKFNNINADNDTFADNTSISCKCVYFSDKYHIVHTFQSTKISELNLSAFIKMQINYLLKSLRTELSFEHSTACDFRAYNS